MGQRNYFGGMAASIALAMPKAPVYPEVKTLPSPFYWISSFLRVVPSVY